MRKLRRNITLTALAIILLGCLAAFPAEPDKKNILLINSYHQGYSWTDSISSGVISTIKELRDYTLFIESLNAKQFGQTKFELTKEHFAKKYAGTLFSGVLVTDNDALDFVIKYKDELFAEMPVVYLGIPNPEEYPLDGSMIYGIKETGDSKQVLTLIRQLLPESRRVFVVTDKTTTGMLQRMEFAKSARLFEGLSVVFPEVIDSDSIYHAVRLGGDFDVIFYSGINQDKDGHLVDPLPVVNEISRIAAVPVFTNEPQSHYTGILGGLFRYGKLHGKAAVELLNSLINSARRDTFKHIATTEQRFFFDRRMLEKYNISEERLPLNSSVFYKKNIFSRQNFLILLIVLFFFSIALIMLSVISHKYRGKHKQSESELLEIEAQKKELGSAYERLALTIAKLEDTNMRLNDTNQKLVEAKIKAEESDKLKSAFLANVSHEIRTPLNSIVGFSSLLVDENLDEEARKSYAELIESNTESLLVLIDEIIDFSKIEAQQLSLKKQHFSVDSLIGELYQIFTLNQRNHEVQLQVNIADQEKQLFAFSDRVRVKQIFINLLSNAFKFTDFGIIEFGYFLSDTQEVILFVKDTGIGIKEEHHQTVFQRFRKLNEVDGKRLYRGTGLGLAITQKLVELLGGKIWIESQFGVGSAFYFTLQDLTLKQKEA